MIQSRLRAELWLAVFKISKPKVVEAPFPTQGCRTWYEMTFLAIVGSCFTDAAVVCSRTCGGCSQRDLGTYFIRDVLLYALVCHVVSQGNNSGVW